MLAVQIRLLGSLQIVLHGQTITGAPNIIASLLSYLALTSSKSVSRSRLAGTLWADQPEQRARRLLTDTLRRLRKWLGDTDEWLIADDETLSLKNFWLDIDEFRARADSGDAADWRAAISLYNGDLLEDLDAEWILSTRADLREKYLLTLERLCRALTDSNNFSEAILIAHRWTLADPLHEEACRAAMRLYARLGRYAAALQHYDRLSHTLADELHVEPLAETRALADSIRAEYQSSLPEAPAPRTLVGRRKERATLLQLAERAQNGKGGLVFVEGEPGIGKTRLLESFAESATWRSITVVWGKARDLMGATPYAPLNDALQSTLIGARLDLLRQRLSPSSVESLSLLMPRLASATTSKTRKQSDLVLALAEVVKELANITPHIFVFDDVQWAGAEFWEAIKATTKEIGKQRLLIVLSYRSGEARNDTVAWRALRDLDQDIAPERIVLKGLSAEECSEIAQSFGHTLEGEAKQTLQARSGGNPFFVQELIGQQSNAKRSLDDLLAQRLSHLTPKARAALEAGAVLGREFTHGTWQALAGDEILYEVAPLTTARFIEETERGYIFQHDLTREHVYRSLTADRLRDLHHRAGEVLLHENAEPSVLAWHFEQAEAWREAVRYQREAGDRAAAIYAHDAALGHYAHAEQLLPHLTDPQTERLAILRSRLRVLHSVLNEEDMWRTITALEQAAAEIDDTIALVEALEARLSLYVIASKWQEVRDTAERAIALVESTGDVYAEARLHRLLGWHLSDTIGEPREAVPHLQRAIDLAEQVNDLSTLTDALIDLAFAKRLLGQSHEASKIAQQALTLSQNKPELRAMHASARQTLAQIEIDLAHWETALISLREVVKLKIDLGDPWSTGQALFALSTTATLMGQHTEARQNIEWMHAALFASPTPPRLTHQMWVYALEVDEFTLVGELEAAEKVLAKMQAWIETNDTSRALLLALTATGRLRLAQGRSAEALLPLVRAVELWERFGLTIELTPLLLYALALHQTGETEKARTALERVESVLRISDVARHTILFHYIRYKIFSAPEALTAAYTEMQRQASLFVDEQMRHDFLYRLVLHREIESRWRAVSPSTTSITVYLTRADVPLGKALMDDDRVEVYWTVDAGESDAKVLETEGKAALRKHRIQRLLQEAHTQNAAPTDRDIADALGVNVRTIERDMAAMGDQGQRPSTRRRKS